MERKAALKAHIEKIVNSLFFFLCDIILYIAVLVLFICQTFFYKYFSTNITLKIVYIILLLCLIVAEIMQLIVINVKERIILSTIAVSIFAYLLSNNLACLMIMLK